MRLLKRMEPMRNYRAILASFLSSLLAVLRRICPSIAAAICKDMDRVVMARLQTDRPPTSRRKPTAATAKITTERLLERLNQNRARRMK